MEAPVEIRSERHLTSRREVPEVPLGVPGRILPLAIRLVCRRGVDDGSGTFGMMIVRVYIVHEDNQTSGLSWQGPSGHQAMFGVDAVNPDH